MKISRFFSIILFFVFNLGIIFGQRIQFDTVKVDATTKIIGRYSRSDKNKIYKKYNFIIEDSARIAKLLNTFRLGERTYNVIADPNFVLSVVKNNKELGYWTIYPTYDTASPHDGNTYKFDLSQILNLNNGNPFDYYCEWKNFNLMDDYEDYLNEQKNKPNYLFDYAPQFKYEGSFEIEFKKSEKFSSPRAISDYITPQIEKIVAKGEYSLVYSLNEKNRQNEDQFTMTISGPKELFNKLKIDNLENENWEPTVEYGVFFYRK